MFKGLGNLASLMKQAGQIKGRMSEMEERLKAERVIGSAGGGMVEVHATGNGEVTSVKLDPLLLEKQDAEMIQDLLPAAINDALAKGRERRMELTKELAEGMDIPGLDSALSQFGNPDG